MKKVEYIEIAALVNLIAYCEKRKREGFYTYFQLPIEKKVLDFLKIWRFPEAYHAATGIKFSESVVIEDQQLLAAEQTSYFGLGDGLEKLQYNPDWNPEMKYKRNFFEFFWYKSENSTSIRPEGEAVDLPRKIGRQWNEPLIIEVLKKHLSTGSSAGEIARVVVYEALSNTVRHPNASIVQVVSKFEEGQTESGVISGPKSLRICVWDDGDGIAETLITSLKNGNSIKSHSLPTFLLDKIHVELNNFGRNKKDSKKRIVDQGEVPKLSSGEGRFLLASLFPGISRAADKKSNIDHVVPFDYSDSEGREPELRSGIRALEDFFYHGPGMGLYALTRTVVDQFLGTIFIRSGSYSLHLRLNSFSKTREYARYDCKITKYPDRLGRFLGNMVVMHIPLKDTKNN